ncbi:MAG: hypothetical protein NVS1B11_05520 [Terriglobales bacterium]
MKYRNRSMAKFVLSVLCLSVIVAAAKPSEAAVGTINKADLSGPWQMTLIGNTGCGFTSMLVTFTLNNSGAATNATITSHYTATSPCADGTVSTGNTFSVNTLNANGSGTAGLSCSAGCGWTFNIQVSADRSVFNVVDVSVSNPNNLLEGSAIHQ